ncbi:NADPH-dependent diflavin oxidoreductase 1 [Monosporozyma unispora]|nr:NAPDH-dependent diflavin reductase [Kazachstania unispora]
MSSTHKIAILYGSETGNSQDFATILSQKLQRLHFATTLLPLGEFNPNDILKVRYLFILVSTTGQGELPRNANETTTGSKKTLWSLLKKKNLPEGFLNHIQVAFFGLGDSSYPKFNFAVRKLYNRMVNQLGARELFDRLEADEQGMAGSNKGTGAGVEAVYFEYEKKIINFLREKFPMMKDSQGNRVERTEIDPSVYLKPKSYLKFAGVTTENTPVINFMGDESVKFGKIVANNKLTADDHFQDVRQLIFTNREESRREIDYNPGDTASIYPNNFDHDVDTFLNNQDQWLSIADKPLEFTNGVPDSLKCIGGIVQPLTLRNLLKYHIDIMSIPRTSFFMKIWQFATDVTRMERGQEQLDDQRDKLKEFGYDEDMQELFDYCNRPRRSVLEILDDFLSVRLPWQYCLDYLPLIKPRSYSISSGPSDPNIELTMAVVKYRTILRKVRKGVCTTYLSELPVGDTSLRYKIQNNNLIKKELHNHPMLLVSPGVGLAPLLSVIKTDNPVISKNIHLFFGCRFKDKDYLYGNKLEEWDAKGRIQLHPVFSRDRENSPDTKYVQDVLWKLGAEMTDLLANHEAVFFLCGTSGRMPLQVRLTVIEMLKKWGGFEDDEAAKDFLKEMEKDGRYIQETW